LQLLLAPGLLAGLLLPPRFLFAGLLLPPRFLLAGLLPLLFRELLLHARAVPVLQALLFRALLFRALLLHVRAIPVLQALLFLHALLPCLRRGALARIVGGPGGRTMRGNRGLVGAGSGPGCLLRGRARLRFGLVVAVLRIFGVGLRSFAGDGLPGQSDDNAGADEAGQDVLAQALHVAPLRVATATAWTQ
jgi:hypothetical protein